MPVRAVHVLEKKLQQLWASVLSIDKTHISADDNFFEAGGDSINAMRLVAKAREKGLGIRLNDILKAPRLWEQAKFLRVKNGTHHDSHV